MKKCKCKKSKNDKKVKIERGGTFALKFVMNNKLDKKDE